MLNYKQPVFLFVLFVFFLSPLWAQKSVNQKSAQYVLSGKVDGIKEGKIYLYSPDIEAGLKDSAYLNNGVFSFRGSINEPLYYILKLEGKTPAQVGFFLEPGGISFRVHKDSMNRAIILGSRSQDEWKEWSAAWRNITSLAGGYYRRLDSVTQKGKVAASADERAIFDKGMASLNQLTADAVVGFIKKFPNSSVGPFVILDRFIIIPIPKWKPKLWPCLAL
jgi:hypothetical protein